MTRKEAFSRMLAGLEADRSRCEELRGLLEQQFDAALRRDGSLLMVAGSAIRALVQALGTSHEARRQCARVLAAPKRPASMSELCALLRGAARDALTLEWQSFDALMCECRRLNQRNATVLMSQFEIVQRVLHGESDTYVHP
ncbi:flagellar protein FlgN [Burkholderia pseudomallei]|uniref:flagellar protein FlgN n=1 Tax=Burkholderia pseudomallei TaxID=28450 RepID=UPI000531EE2B|nr:flagellar protein FlgN [Burkholderia pseudomallei]KGS38545.1 flgN family protein [Burkholderia pseudomallei ABCPW 107]KGW81376.1 flgN family protein [Burkholderia pseudomallei MSHR456]KKB67890.1 flgN family protein [Burkholderia pseudomallei MSHR1079]ONB87158.1 flagellar biosynthesis protein FliR [Burkholderia pseudomallei]